MKIYSKVNFAVLILAIISISSSAYSATWARSEVAMVYPQADGSIVVTLKQHAPECTNGSHYLYLRAGENNVNQEAVKNIYSLLLAAANTKKEVAINFDESTHACFINRAYVIY